MSAPDATDPPAVRTYRCSRCPRCFVAVDGGTAGRIVCTCGAPLSPAPLPHGIYELCSPLSVESRTTHPAPSPKEPDDGYGASHGYGPAHGGPTGPGDIPAKTSSSPS
jgi:hypothetical protein